jgi:HEAT repeat protein
LTDAIWLALLAATTFGTEWTNRLESSSTEIRIQAYRSLGSLDTTTALIEIATAVRSEADPSVRTAASHAMARLDLNESELIEVLTQSEAEIARAWAAHALGHHRTTPARLALQEAFDDTNENVRSEAYQAISMHGDRQSLNALSRAATNEPSPALQQLAIDSARAIVSGQTRGFDLETELSILSSGAPEQRLLAVQHLATLGDWRALHPILSAARSGSIRRGAVLALGALGDHRAVPELITFLGDHRVRREALASLAQLQDEAAIPALADLLMESDPTTRLHAVRALTWIGGDVAISQAAGLAADPEFEVRSEVVHAFATLEGATRVEGLAPFTQDESPFIRAEAAMLIGESNLPSTIDILTPLLRDEDMYVVLTAADAIASCGAETASARLHELLERTEDPEHRGLIEDSIAKLQMMRPE